jgi:hypothetical protein
MSGPRPTPSQLAEVGYRAYADNTGGQTFDGRTMPDWERLPARTVRAWMAAAEAITAAALGTQRSAAPAPSVGRIVHYRLSEQDATEINRLRDDTRVRMAAGGGYAPGVQVHQGNCASAGDLCPAVIVRVFNPASPTVNLQVLLDGTDTVWATSRVPGDEPGQWSWPPRV